MKGIVIKTISVREFSWISNVWYVHLQPDSLVSHIRIHWDGLSRSIKARVTIWFWVTYHHYQKSPTRILHRTVYPTWLPCGNSSVHQKKRFCETYGDIASLILVPVEEPLLRAVMRFWDPSYRCFTFGKNDLVPTVEEYSVLIGVEL